MCRWLIPHVSESHQMAIRDVPKPPHPDNESLEPPPKLFPQGKRPEIGRYRLEVDRQMKGSFTSFEAAQTAGQAIKTKHPIVKVSIYDAFEGLNTTIEAPAA